MPTRLPCKVCGRLCTNGWKWKPQLEGVVNENCDERRLLWLDLDHLPPISSHMDVPPFCFALLASLSLLHLSTGLPKLNLGVLGALTFYQKFCSSVTGKLISLWRSWAGVNLLHLTWSLGCCHATFLRPMQTNRGRLIQDFRGRAIELSNWVWSWGFAWRIKPEQKQDLTKIDMNDGNFSAMLRMITYPY